MLPVALPAAIEHQRPKCSQSITRRLAPLHASILLTSCNDQVIRLFYLPTTDIALLNSALALVRNPERPCLELGNQFLQFCLVLGFWALRLQHCYRAQNIPAPQAAIQPAQEPGFGCLTSTDSTAEVGAFLPQMMPVEEHRLVREPSKGPGKEAADPARAIRNQEQRAERPQTHEHGYVQALEERRADPTQVTIALLGRKPRRA